MGIGNRWGGSRFKIYAVRLKTAWLHRRTAIFSGVSVIALATLFGLLAGYFISTRQLIKDIEALTEQNQKVSQQQHDTLFHQIECLAEVSIIAAKGNDVKVTSLEDCKYTVTPKAKEQAEVIIVPQIIREFQTETRTETQTQTQNQTAPQEQPGKAKGKKK